GEAALDLGRVRTGGAGVGLGGVVLVLVLGVLVLVGVLVAGHGLVVTGRRGGDLGLFLEVVVEAGDQLGQALLAGLVQLPVLEQQADRPREAGQRGQHL